MRAFLLWASFKAISLRVNLKRSGRWNDFFFANNYPVKYSLIYFGNITFFPSLRIKESLPRYSSRFLRAESESVRHYECIRVAIARGLDQCSKLTSLHSIVCLPNKMRASCHEPFILFATSLRPRPYLIF